MNPANPSPLRRERSLPRAVLVLVLCLAAGACSRAPVSRGETPKTTGGLFVDVAERSGIQFRHTNGDTGRFLFPETFGGGCAFLDYDDDGWPDALLLSCGRLDGKPGEPNLTLYHNEGGKGFRDVTIGSGLEGPVGYAQALAVGDLDGDGRPDIFVAGYGRCTLFRNRGAAPLFEDVTASAGVADTERGPRWASGATWFDYDLDGRLDLFVIHYAVWSPAIDRKCPRPDGSPGYCVPNVYEGDGVRLFHNLGGGRFEDVTSRAGLGGIRGRGLAVASLDFDGDGRPDLYIANDLDRNYLLRNLGTGAFAEVGVEAGAAFGSDGLIASGMGIALGDYDRSGRESLFVPNLNGERFSLFRAEPGGRFSYSIDAAGLAQVTLNHSGWGAAFLDYDRDGWPDLISANGNVHPAVAADLPGAAYEEPKGLYRNTGSGFVDDSARAGDMRTPRAGRALAIGDFDNDGRIDVLCVNRNDRAELFHNESPDRGNWISLRLVGSKSNREAIGARVTLQAGDLRLVSECRRCSSYGSSSDSRLFFGLGDHRRIDHIEVHWPSGRRDNFSGVDVGRFWVLTEGQGRAPDTRIPTAGKND